MIARGYVGVLIPVALVLTLLTRFALRRLALPPAPAGPLRPPPAAGRHAGHGGRRGRAPRSGRSGRAISSSAPASTPTGRPHAAGRRRARCRSSGRTTDMRQPSRRCRGRLGGRHRRDRPPASCAEVAATWRARGVDLLDGAGDRRRGRAPHWSCATWPGCRCCTWRSRPFTGPQRVAKEVDRPGGAVLACWSCWRPCSWPWPSPSSSTARGPVFFRQPRVGRDGRPLRDGQVPHDGGRRRAAAGRPRATATRPTACCSSCATDPRVTRVGRVLRRYSIDELPQLLNVLRGEMSLVGPRPPLPAEVELYEHHVTPPAAGQARHHRAVAGQRPVGPVVGRGRAPRPLLRRPLVADHGHRHHRQDVLGGACARSGAY